MDTNNSSACWQDSGDILQGIMIGPDGPNLQEMADLRQLDLPEYDLDHFHTPQPSMYNWVLPDYADNLYSQHTQDAWTPLRASTLSGGCPQASLLDANYGLNKTHYTTAPSESGSHLMSSNSDSGYGSTKGPLQHTGDSLSSPRSSFKEHAFVEQGITEESHMGSLVGVPAYINDGVVEHQVRCSKKGCPWIGKCPSDKRKHEARHQKQHKCTEPGCTRKEGFGTANDLERHRKCVHSKEPSRGPRVVYKCFGAGCPRADKQWPRLDNFKQHLNRMHKSESTDDLLRRSSEWYDQVFARQMSEKAPSDSSMDDATSELQSIVSSQHDEMDMDMENSPLSYPFDRDHILSSQLPTPKPFSSPSYSQQVEGISLGAPMGLHTPWLQDTNEPTTATSFNPEPMMANLPPPLVTYMNNLWNSHSRRSSNGSDEGINLEAESSHLSQHERQKLQQFLSLALNQLAEGVSAGPSPATPKEGWIKCDQCDKTTRLQCEMKKHLKRHERPYSCTFPHCHKSFGSKADWKRHEKTQHLVDPSWLCTCIDRQTKSPCGMMFYQEPAFALHLSQQHRQPKAQATKYIQSNRLDIAAGQNQFWCGFCRNNIPFEHQTSQPLNERFDHIDMEHFRKGERGAEWVLPDGSNLGGSESQRKRKFTGSHSISDRDQ